MKSDWLPTMPLHVAIWSQLALELDLDWADQGMSIRLLANAWSSGTLRRMSWATDQAWAAAERLWPELDAERKRNLETRASLSERGKTGADARWNGRSMQRPLADDESGNATAKEHKHKHKQEQKQKLNQDQEQKLPSSLRSDGARRQAPPDLQLTQPRFEYALDSGLTTEAVGEEWEVFTDHRFKTPRTKWDLAWKAWVRKAVEIRGLGSSRRGPGDRGNTAAGRTMSNVEQFLKQSGAL